jgi:hypothetical protein
MSGTDVVYVILHEVAIELIKMAFKFTLRVRDSAIFLRHIQPETLAGPDKKPFDGCYTPRMRAVVKPVIGVFLVIFGVAALVTPFTPGAWLALVGMEMLGLSRFFPRRVREPWEKFKVKLPEFWRKFAFWKRR